jgi:hypothetical protein
MKRTRRERVKRREREREREKCCVLEKEEPAEELPRIVTRKVN